MNLGASNRTIYDTCQYQKQLFESTQPLSYQLYFGAHENCNKAVFDRFWVKYQLVDIESELFNLTRPLSNCDQFKYHPNCGKSGLCTSTFHRSVPVVYAPEVKAIVYNNIPRQTHPGYRVPRPNICNRN